MAKLIKYQTQESFTYRLDFILISCTTRISLAVNNRFNFHRCLSCIKRKDGWTEEEDVVHT